MYTKNVKAAIHTYSKHIKNKDSVIGYYCDLDFKIII